MVTLSTINVNPNLSPRVARIDSGVEEIVLQDYVDTLRDLEDDFQNMSFPIFINATGKQDLGGGLLVAITVEELNLNLAFEPDKTSDESGTITTASGPPNSINRQRVIDSTADFVTAGIRPGSLIVNFTDLSVTDVIQVISATELEVEALEDGTDNQFELGDFYKVWTVDQKRTSGGNLVAVDENGSSIPAILPTAFTQVVQATSSSATIQELTDIQFSSYEGGVTIKQTGQAGTAFPIGTRREPVNNWPDALLIAQTVGVNRIYLEDNQTVPASTDLSANYYIIGDGATVVDLTIPSSANTSNLRVQDVNLTNSVLDELNLVERCTITGCTIGPGFYNKVAFSGTNTFSGAGQVNIFDGYSAVAGGGVTTTPEFVVGSGVAIVGRNYSGGAEFSGKTGTDEFSWDFFSGQVITADDNTGGTMTFRGQAKWTNRDTYAGTTVINADELLNKDQIAKDVWDSLLTDHQVTGSFGLYIQRKLLTTARFLGLSRDV